MRNRVTRAKGFILSQLARPFCCGEVAASNHVRDELLGGMLLPSKRVRVIENACAVTEIADEANQARSQRPQGEPVILMVSRMDDAKDHGTLIKACAKLIHSGLKLRVRFAGDGPLRSSHEALCGSEGIQERVEFLGSRGDMPQLLGQSDVAVLSTNSEGFGIALIEAMSARTPVIATDLPACREVLDSGRCGILVAPGDSDSLAHSIRRLIEDNVLRSQLVDAAAVRVLRNYDIKRTATRYADLLMGTPDSLALDTEVA